MPKPKDRVSLFKQESGGNGGDPSDLSPFLGDEPLDPSEDAPDLAGIYIQESGVLKDSLVTVYRENGEMFFEDISHSGLVNRVNLSDLSSVGGGGITSNQHKTLRHGIHFIDSGPAEGFLSGAFKESLYSGIYLTSETWYVDSGKTQKIVELSILYSGIKPITEEWKIYDTDGTTVLSTITDSMSYSGIKETDRTRTIV